MLENDKRNLWKSTVLASVRFGRFLVLRFDDSNSNEVAMFCQKMQKTSSMDEAFAFDKREQCLLKVY